jgi:small subunit ribosomal protein S17
MRERRKVLTGRVVADKMAKTVIVEVEHRRTHPLYGKVVTHTRRFKAHNEEPEAKLGDLVKIIESRPYSREKHFRVSEIVQRGIVVEQAVDVELESLREKEQADRAALRAEEERRAAERLSKLAGSDEDTEEDEASGDESADESDGSEEE